MGLSIPVELAGSADLLQTRRQQVEFSYAPLRNAPMDGHYLLDTPLPYLFMPTTPVWAGNNRAELVNRLTVTNQQVQHVATRMWSHSSSEVLHILKVYDRYPHFLDV